MSRMVYCLSHNTTIQAKLTTAARHLCHDITAKIHTAISVKGAKGQFGSSSRRLSSFKVCGKLANVPVGIRSGLLSRGRVEYLSNVSFASVANIFSVEIEISFSVALREVSRRLRTF